MTTKNSITGDLIKSKPQSENYKNNYDGIDWSIKQDDPRVLNVGCNTVSDTPPRVKTYIKKRY